VPDASQITGAGLRTIRRWIASEVVTSKLEELNGHPVRLILRDSLPSRGGVTPAHGAANGTSDLAAGSAVCQAPAAGSANGHRDPDGSASGHEEDASGTAMAVPVLQARLEGAQLAAKLHAQRFREARQQIAEERERSARTQAEVEFLRQQLAARTDAERELRLLLAQVTRALPQPGEVPALEARNVTPKAKEPPKRARWWALWSRW